MSHVNTPPNHEVFDHNTVTTDGQDQPTATPQPKVIAATVTGLVLAVVVAVLSAVTPQMLESLGSWGVLIYAGIVALGAGLAGYIKRPSAIS